MDHRSIGDAVVFIVAGTFIATYALLLISSQNPRERLAWFGGRHTVFGRDRVFPTLSLVGIGLAVWGGTGLQHHTDLWQAVLIAVGPMVLLRIAIVVIHNRRLAGTLDVERDSPRSR